jgi:SEC-C motif
MDHHRVSRNDPCPCGSGKKYKNCCLRREVEARPARPSPKITDLDGKLKKRPQHPIGTVAFYGPDDKITTKIAAGVINSPSAEPILERWVATDVTTNPRVQREIKEFFEKHGVKSVAMSEGNMGCPHEEGEDFPDGEDCPFCPFWAGKQGSNRRDWRE